MSFMDKVKNFFYDEEEIEEVVPEVRKDSRRKTSHTEPKKKINIYDIENEKNKVNRKEKRKEEVKEVNERDLFKAERTFNFPMDVGDEDDFEPVKKENIRETKKVEPEVKKDALRTTRSATNHSSNYSYNSFNSSNTSNTLRPHQRKKEESHFKPSPVISPIYGILNEDYKKEEITESSSKTKELSFDKKTVDFDTIRKKAYASLDEELEKTLSDQKKDIFYNLEDNKKEDEEENTPEKELEEEYVEKPYKKDEDVIITYNDEDPESEEKESSEEELEVPKITRTKRRKTEAEEVAKEDDDESTDLFKIIDDMYKDPSDEEEE